MVRDSTRLRHTTGTALLVFAWCSGCAPQPDASGGVTGFATQTAALTATDAVTPTDTHGDTAGDVPVAKSGGAAAWPAKVEHIIALHKRDRARIAALPADRQPLELARSKLNPHMDGEDCAIYVHERWTDAQKAVWASRGVMVNPDLWIPPLPAHRHVYGFHIARVPYDMLAELAADSSVARVATLEVGYQLNNDIGAAEVHATDVFNGTGVPQFDGTGVKVCIADSGLDVAHPDIKAPVEAKDITDGPSFATWGNDVANHVAAHGTHVTGTVVGSGALSNGQYRGAAPGASLYFYKIGGDVVLEGGGPSIAGGDEILALSRSMVVGCDVFSMSIGASGGIRDGSGPMEQAIDVATTAGMSVFISAGNEGEQTQGRAVTIAPGGSVSLKLNYANYAAATDSTLIRYCAVWKDAHPQDGNLSFSGPASLETPTGVDVSPRGTETLCADIAHSTASGDSETWTLTLNNAPTGDVANVWLLYEGGVVVTVQGLPATNSYMVTSPATADTAIAVAAWSHRNQWTSSDGGNFASPYTLGTIAGFSSRGPRIDGVLKPDLAAPGAMTISTNDSAIPSQSYLLIAGTASNSDYLAMQGTSMATPLAAGCGALIRQAYPLAGPEYVRWALTSTASAAANPDDLRGYGLINVRDAILTSKCGDGVRTGIEECDDGNASNDDCCTTLCGWADSCNDYDVCTFGDACVNHVCVGTPKDCVDDNFCTLDFCTAVVGACMHLPAHQSENCNDGNPCTVAETCNNGTCSGTGIFCSDGIWCTDDTCNPSTGKCLFTVNTEPCDDGLACTVNDACSQGTCQGTLNPCDDQNVCTTDACHPIYGCEHTPTYGPCNDGNNCTIYDNCNSLSVCKGADKVCDDGVNCNIDYCYQGGCYVKPMDCSDGDPCTEDLCSPLSGTCSSQAKFCLDSNTCTSDACDPQTGECLHANLSGIPCADPYWCTKADTCSDGVCSGTPIICADNNPCTDDVCDEITGGNCWYKPNTVPCDDGNPCTVSDACANSKCAGGGAKVCDDNNVCTFDSCVKAEGGCVYSLPIASYPACDDGDICTTDSYCYGGACITGVPIVCSDGNPCTDDSCASGLGCQHVVGSSGCNDGNACTDDSCDAKGVCWHIANNANACTDGGFCTVNAHCKAGVCAADPVDCDDGNPCTSDSCGYVMGMPQGACTHTNTTDACSDGNACTLGDVCSGGACQPGAGALDCNDGNVCTADSCNAAKGCEHMAISSACDDGNPCTAADHCKAGECVGTDACDVDAGDTAVDDTVDTADTPDVADADAAGDAVDDAPIKDVDKGDAVVKPDAGDAEAGTDAADAVADVADVGAPDVPPKDIAAVDVAQDASADAADGADAADAPDVADAADGGIDAGKDGALEVADDVDKDVVVDVGKDVVVDVGKDSGVALDAPDVPEDTPEVQADSADTDPQASDTPAKGTSPCSAQRSGTPSAGWTMLVALVLLVSRRRRLRG